LPASPVSPSRVLGVGGVAFASFNNIVGAGIFGLPALAAAALGPAAVLGYIISTIVLGLVGLCLAEAGSRVTEAGGPFAYATVPFGPAIGGMVGTLMWVSCVSGSAAVANLWIETLASAWPNLGTTGPRFALILAFYAGLALVNVRGTRQGSRLSVAMALIKTVPLVGIVLLGLMAIDPANLRWTHVPTPAALGNATVLLFFAFTGIESGLYASAEVRNPERTIPRAILLTAVVVVILYLGLQVVAQGVLGARLPVATAPLVSVAEILLGPWGSALMILAIVLSTSGYLVADALCSPRALYALSVRGQLPRFLATLHPRFGTPASAVCLYLAFCALLAISGSFKSLALLTSAATLVVYGVCCLGVLRMRALKIEQAGTPFRAPGGPLVPLAATVLIGWLLSSLSRDELIAAVAFTAVTAIAYAAHAKLRRPIGPAASG
jgi:basic amino acid/polyamine antiporter, APA family